ncbi:MAG: glycoside hydrolase family 2 protein, partial [Nakamurella sp.]
MTRRVLTDGWTVQLLAGPVPDGLSDEIPATVPGCVHTDLLAQRLIPDPYLDLNEGLVQWIGETDVCYRTTFDLMDEDQQRIDLVALGLDTVATVTLNGVEIGRTRNQHRSYRFDVRSAVRRGNNELRIDFDAPLRAARESEQRIGSKPLVGDALPYNALRKMACNFGWDWGPTLTTSGIWKPISLDQWSTARLAGVVPNVSVDAGGTGRVRLSIELERTGADELSLEVDILGPDGEQSQRQLTTTAATATVELPVPNAKLWWPNGYGAQPLYRTTVRVSHRGSVIDTWSRDIGFRTAEVRMQKDEYGTCFEFHLNGQYVFVKGANWIPDDCFPSRVTGPRYEAAIRDAVDADMNMLRVWGGGLYESDEFYDICNREGILVWQDFAFACAIYSEAPEMWAEVEAEARENVARLAPHPSLVMWNGSNENIEAYFHWGFRERMAQGETWGRGYYDDLLPRVLAEIDPTRGYIPSSPYSPVDYADPRDPDNGPVHSWKVWFSEDYLTYRSAIPRFVAEFGFQGAPNFATLSQAVHDDPMRPDSPGMLTHQKAIDGNGKLERGWAPHLPAPATFDDWHFTTQLNQVRAITCAVSHFRSHSPRTAGYLIWQLNDCWPAVSWSAVDAGQRRKPLWYALRSLNAARVLFLQPRAGGLALIVSNDSPERWTDVIEVSRISIRGHRLAAERLTVDVPPRGSSTVALSQQVATPYDADAEMLCATAYLTPSIDRAWWYFVEDLDLKLPSPALSSTVERIPAGYIVTV